MGKRASELWDLLHESASHLDPNSEIYKKVQAALDEGIDDAGEMRSLVFTELERLITDKVCDTIVQDYKPSFEETHKAIREAGGDAWDNLDVEQELAAMRGQPQGTEARVCNDITERQALGAAKYGKAGDNKASLRDWLQHAYEQALDMAIYLKRAIENLDSEATISENEQRKTSQ